MKRIFSLTLASVLCLSMLMGMTACNSKETYDIDANTTIKTILSSLETAYGDTMVKDSRDKDEHKKFIPVELSPTAMDMDISYFVDDSKDKDISDVKLTSRAFYSAEGSDLADYAIFVLENASDADVVKEACSYRVTDIAQAYRGYEETNYEKMFLLSKAVIKIKGNVVYYFMGHCAAEAEEKLLEILK